MGLERHAMLSDFVVYKDRPEVMHLPTGLIWQFKRTPEGYWDGLVVNMDQFPPWPAYQLARLSEQAGEELKREWKI